MELDLEAISGLLDTLRAQRELLERPRQMTREQFKDDVERQYVAKHALLLAIQSCLDICAHIIAAAGTSAPTDYAEMPRTLATLGILPSDLAEKLAQAAGFRNRLVHVYQVVDLDVVYDVLQNDLGDFDAFMTHIGQLVERHKNHQEGDRP